MSLSKFQTDSSTSFYSKSKSSSIFGSSSASAAAVNSDLAATEKIYAENVNQALKNVTESMNQTLNLSHSTDKHFTEVNLDLGKRINAELSKLEHAKSSFEARLQSIQAKAAMEKHEIKPEVYEGLFARHKIVKEKLFLRQASLRAILSTANEYLVQSNVGEVCDTMEEVHNRFLILQKEINGSNDVVSKLETMENLLEKFRALAYYVDNQNAATDPYSIALEKLEREETIGDVLRQIQHVREHIQKADDEPNVKTTSSQSSASTTNGSRDIFFGNDLLNDVDDTL